MEKEEIPYFWKLSSEFVIELRTLFVDIQIFEIFEKKRK